jgi:hypothetical protein
LILLSVGIILLLELKMLLCDVHLLKSSNNRVRLI